MFSGKKTNVDMSTAQRMFSSRDVCRISGITGRQLQWWDERNIVSPREAGHRRSYLVAEVLEILAVAELRRKGLSLQRIRRVTRLLRREITQCLGKSWDGNSSLYLLTDGHTLHLEQQPARILDLLSNATRAIYLVCLSDQSKRIASYSDSQRRANEQYRLF